MDYKHTSVMLDEAIDILMTDERGIYVDGTVGGGGHARAMASRLDGGLLIGIDRDQEAIDAAADRLSGFNVRLVRSNFSRFDEILDELSIDRIDGAIFDLGVSSHQIDDASRGFSYMHDAPLDMRMDIRQQLSAFDVVNHYSEDQLVKIFSEYGEEKFSKRIARAIVERRRSQSIETTGQLVELIKGSVPALKGAGHPAKRVFQAIRIEVNNELGVLDGVLRSAVNRLKVGGRLAVITFHSLEDRIVKTTFKELATDCICPKNIPVCVCGHRAQIKLLGRARTPSSQEIKNNPRAKSAKLRAAEKIQSGVERS
ncbi:MAG: 16S rRNA (cytosine(1402)-N(4))-methyltransferase RsmH, partial [Selenomonadaceae bacterium]|nr:16S rRNA (cytosine(1402)-N(4))-methyltransferase RsmH [Selenomonadaceae bacterium]